MDKQYGQDLLNTYNRHFTALKNVKTKIEKRFQLIVENYSQYHTEEDRNFLIESTNIYSLPIEVKCGIIMRTEGEYVRQTSQQGELFD